MYPSSTLLKGKEQQPPRSCCIIHTGCQILRCTFWRLPVHAHRNASHANSHSVNTAKIIYCLYWRKEVSQSSLQQLAEILPNQFLFGAWPDSSPHFFHFICTVVNKMKHSPYKLFSSLQGISWWTRSNVALITLRINVPMQQVHKAVLTLWPLVNKIEHSPFINAVFFSPNGGNN